MATNSSINLKTAASGKLVQAQGVGVACDFTTATYPVTATGTGTILQADGTNWVPTTATYPGTAGTTGNYLTSDGTNIVSTDVGQLKMTPLITLSNAQIKALHGTPIQVIAAPAAGYAVFPVSVIVNYVYGGNNVFTAGAAQSIALYWGTTTQMAVVLSNSNLTTAQSQIRNLQGPSVANANFTSVYANAVNLYNASATEITGNAANDNVVYLRFLYNIIQMS